MLKSAVLCTLAQNIQKYTKPAKYSEYAKTTLGISTPNWMIRADPKFNCARFKRNEYA